MTGRLALALAALAALLVAALVLGRGAERRTLFFEGRPVRWSGAHGVMLRSDGQLLAFEGTVPRPMLLRPGGRRLRDAAAGPDGAVWLVDSAGSVLVRQADGSLREAGRMPVDDRPRSVGPDGRVYLLARPETTTARSRLYALDPASGAVRDSWDFDSALPTLTVDRRGSVRTADPTRLLPSADPARRAPMTPFDLPAPGQGRVRSADFAGRPLLVNVWASWCGPCRTEMPALDSLVRAYGGRLAFAALSDDVDDDDARAFLRETGFTFPVGLGGGRLKARYRYVGLPHTILADAEGRVIYQWTGFGGDEQLRSIAALVDAELARRPARAAGDATRD